ncbi:hypothetical protein [Amnibacterium sp.]|uniref:hypothetical protein n=1 Tax=Amnibacterium sp. TaxID=1872496 RepID=UPI003F7C780D
MDGSTADHLRRLRAIAAEWRDEVVSDFDRAEGIEGRYGHGSPESDAAWASLDEARSRLAEAQAAVAAAIRERAGSTPR